MMRSVLLFFFIMVAASSFAQREQEEKNQIIQQRVEFISEELENEEVDLTDVTEVLLYRIDHPINLNSATWEELQELFLLTDLQINDLFAHREAYGKLISVYELQSLKYWDMKTINIVLPFIKVDDKLDQLHVTLKEALKEGKFEAFLRYQRIPENKEGYADVPDSVIQNSNSYYYGNPDRYYTRLRFKYRNNLSIGLTAEKDPGEQFFRGAQKNGFDFYSAHAFYKGGKYLRAVALGDYQVQIGQGLNLWTSFAFQKTADATNVKRSANPLRPYTSVDETRFFRGAAVDVGLGDFSLLMFGSVKGVDGNILTDSLLDEIEFATSINLTGFHRTNSEIARKDGLQERIGGANLRYSKRSLQLGVSAVYQGYDRDFIRDTLPYNRYDFRGRSTTGISADYSWVFRNFNFFGETAYSTHSNSWANMHGVLFSVDTRVAMSMIYRNYQRGYHSFYNAGFREGSRTQNEKGLYTGIKVNFTQAFSVNGYVDVFKFPWLRFQVDAPSDGHEWLIQPSYRPSRSLEIYFRFREQVRPRNSRDSDGTVTTIEDVRQRNYRMNFSYKVTESVRLKSRIEYVTINRPSNTPEAGFVISQDVIYKPKSMPFSFAARYALFDTDSFDSRIYTFENNALYVFSAPAYFYQGSRAYLLVRYKFLRRFDLWARYGTSIFSNRNSIGSGAEEILGNTRSDITIQLRMQF